MSGLSRYVHVLRLFGEQKSEWTVQEIATSLNVPASTIYRTVRELVADNFLEPSTEANYRLGPAFIEYDRLIRLTDPLAGIGISLLRECAIQARAPCAAVLARLYGDTVMCVADVVARDSTVRTSYERGRPRPLLQGATSKAILAQLPTRKLNRLLADHTPRRKFDPTPEQLREQLVAARKRGYCVTRGEVDAGLMGIAAPVSLPERGLIASLSLIVESAAIDDAAERRLVLLVVSTASLLTEELKLAVTLDGARRATS
ncbi:IclR family transcriptional regulator [Bradyrhizobium prioriisuperbiae]|uniref:IclR family transcriptional regulator n=1 Tax=Bradyrhizobium prioriisuperbiae TaxID=2854389 RepID=UPI0028F04DB5|nr:IclR family transcriptional regulator C-terminal domain-containing protein [Bradyrhizobium prioritasuperba]